MLNDAMRQAEDRTHASIVIRSHKITNKTIDHIDSLAMELEATLTVVQWLLAIMMAKIRMSSSVRWKGGRIWCYEAHILVWPHGQRAEFGTTKVKMSFYPRRLDAVSCSRDCVQNLGAL